jgi:alpha-methylacyl-CoA racemase
VLDWDEAPAHAHNQARGTFLTAHGVVQPAPAPRFSRSAPGVPAASRGTTVADILQAWDSAVATEPA